MYFNWDEILSVIVPVCKKCCILQREPCTLTKWCPHCSEDIVEKQEFLAETFDKPRCMGVMGKYHSHIALDAALCDTYTIRQLLQDPQCSRWFTIRYSTGVTMTSAAHKKRTAMDVVQDAKRRFETTMKQLFFSDVLCLKETSLREAEDALKYADIFDHFPGTFENEHVAENKMRMDFEIRKRRMLKKIYEHMKDEKAYTEIVSLFDEEIGDGMDQELSGSEPPETSFEMVSQNTTSS